MTIYVELPSDPLIELNAFCRAIAKAVCPADENGPEGIDCIVGKLVTHQTPLPESAVDASGLLATSWQSVLASQDGKTLDQLRPTDQGDSQCELPFHPVAASPIVEVSFPYTLTDADRAALEPLLPSLPQLRYPISSEQQEAFKQAYCELAERPTWLPILISDNTMGQRKADQEHIRAQHQRALLQEVSSGRLTLLDANHAPVKGPGVGAFLARAQAMAYLEQLGLTYRTTEYDPMPVASQKSTASDEQTAPRASPIGIPKGTPEEKAAAVKRCNDLKQQGIRNFAAITAEEFYVSTKTINNWRNEAKKQSVTPDSVIAQSYARKTK